MIPKVETALHALNDGVPQAVITNLAGLRTGDRMNVECDMVGKYVARAVELSGIVNRES